MVRFEIISGIRFVVWTVLKKCPISPILEKPHEYRVYKRKSTLYRTRNGSDMRVDYYGGTTQNRTGDKGFAGPCLTAWPWCRRYF